MTVFLYCLVVLEKVILCKVDFLSKNFLSFWELVNSLNLKSTNPSIKVFFGSFKCNMVILRYSVIFFLVPYATFYAEIVCVTQFLVVNIETISGHYYKSLDSMLLLCSNNFMYIKGKKIPIFILLIVYGAI